MLQSFAKLSHLASITRMALAVGANNTMSSAYARIPTTSLDREEAQLMLTNTRNAFRGQSRSPNMVPFHMLGIVSY